MDTLTARLKALRLESGLSQAALGAKLGLPQSHISKIEKGLGDPRLSTLADIARVLNAELLLVPRHLVPQVTALARGEKQQRPRWRIDEEADDT